MRLSACLVLGLLAVSGCDCGGDTTGNTGTGGAGASGGAGNDGGDLFVGVGGSGGTVEPCVNLECQQVVCGGGVTTTISGTIYDPSGTLPLYNVGVYVPNAALSAVPDTLTCDTCDATFSGDPLVSTLSDTHGAFVLENVPVGDNIPLVIQTGKWRREITVSTVAECVDNPLTDPQVTRLPKSMAEGNLPRIALTTGSADPLFCLLRRLGIEDTEYGIAGSPARLHFFRGFNGSQQFDNGFGASPGATFPYGPDTLWTTDWQNYDVVLMSCEGSTYPSAKDGRRTAMRDYINAGGRVFATHYHYNWFEDDAPADLMSVATFDDAFVTFDNQLVDIDQSFPKGVALAEWMDFVDGSSPFGQFRVFEGRQHTQFVDTSLARIWVTYQADVEYFSFNAPIGAPEEDQCGRMVFSDIHVSSGAGFPSGPFPSTCTNGPLTEQEKALIFLLFDLSACITPEDDMCPPGQTPCGEPGDPMCPGQCVNGCCQQIPQ